MTKIRLQETPIVRKPMRPILKLYTILFFCAAILVADIASAQPPTISIINNTKTNTNSSYGIFLNNSESITFWANTTNTSNTWKWYKDSVLQTNNFNNFTTSFTKGSYHYVFLNTTNISGVSNNLAWGINVFAAMASSPADNIPLLNETPANNLENAIVNNSLPEITESSIKVYINVVGLSFYAFIWFIAFAMFWIKQASINIPAIVGVIFGGLIISFLPAQYQLVSQVFIVFGIFAVIYVFYKGRG